MQFVRVRRLPGAVVVLGFVLFVGSILGTLAGTLTYFGSKIVEEQSKKTPAEVRADLQKASLPDPLIDKELGAGLTDDEVAALQPPQQQAVTFARLGKLGQKVPPQQITSGAKFLIGASLLGLVIGWLLRSKRGALRCDECGSIARSS
jgi:hypothetical protein